MSRDKRLGSLLDRQLHHCAAKQLDVMFHAGDMQPLCCKHVGPGATPRSIARLPSEQHNAGWGAAGQGS